MGDPSKLRIADADREQMVSELHEHAVAGRLTSDELEERVGSAYQARTRADLERLRADLPVSSTSAKLALSKRKAHLRRRLLQEAGGSVGVSAICVGIWLASGPGGGFWPGWVIGLTLLPVLTDGWRLFGPASDLEVVEARLQARHERRLERGRRHRYRRLPW
jgi:DUF1707 SHOCT-like domain